MKSILLILLMFTSLLSALDRKIRIADSENKPISNVVVKVAGRAFLSNEKGIASLTSKSEADSVLIHKIGYEDENYLWIELTANIKLETKAIEIQGISVFSAKNSGNPTLRKMIIKNDSEFSNADNAADLLKNHSEIRLVGSDIAGSEQTVSLLGHQSKHTLVLLDGIPLNSSGQKFDISTIPADIIESIEVIPQNAVASTGAGAIGGAINIITKNDMEKERSVLNKFTYQSGSLGYMSTGVNLKFTHPNYFLDMNYSWQEADNDFEYEYFLTNDPIIKRRENNYYTDNVMNINFRMNNPIHLKYNLIKQGFKKGLPGPIDQQALYDEAQLYGDVWRHTGSLNYQYKKILFKLQGFWFDEETEFDNLDSTGMSLRQRSENYSDKRGTELQTSYNWKDFNGLLELEYRREGFSNKHFDRKNQLITQSSVTGIYQENSAVALTWGWHKSVSMMNLNLQQTGRLDHIVQMESDDWEASWQSEAVMTFENELLPELSFRYGTSYSLPSFYDLYWVGDSQAQGNPDLKPEYARGGSVELGYEGFWGSLKAGWLQNRIEDMIYWQRGINGSWKPHNLNDAEITNYKLDAVLQPFQFIELGASWLRTFSLNKTKTATGTDFYNNTVVNTPRSLTSSYARFKYDDAFIELDWDRTGKQYTQPNESWALDAYHTFNFQAGYGLSLYKIYFELNGKVINFTDEDYNKYASNPSPGLSWQVGVSLEYVYK